MAAKRPWFTATCWCATAQVLMVRQPPNVLAQTAFLHWCPKHLLYNSAHTLYATPFATFETEIKQQLNAMFGAYGFDAERDIEAVTVNRWSHGYAYEYMDLHDPKWPKGEAPHELGRKSMGRISIANSDSEAHAYVHAAIDSAWRAVAEQLGQG